MSTYTCDDCDIKFRIKKTGGSGSAFAEICPCCGEEEPLQYL